MSSALISRHQFESAVPGDYVLDGEGCEMGSVDLYMMSSNSIEPCYWTGRLLVFVAKHGNIVHGDCVLQSNRRSDGLAVTVYKESKLRKRIRGIR